MKIRILTKVRNPWDLVGLWVLALMLVAVLVFLSGKPVVSPEAAAVQQRIERLRQQSTDDIRKAAEECAADPGCDRPIQIDDSFQGKPIPKRR